MTDAKKIAMILVVFSALVVFLFRVALQEKAQHREACNRVMAQARTFRDSLEVVKVFDCRFVLRKQP